jgi:hypothetical protein
MPGGDLLDAFVAFLERNLEQAGYDGEVDISTADFLLGKYRFWGDYINLMMIRWPGRSFALTARGRMALVSSTAKPGDTVSVILGAKLPQVLAPLGDGQHWTYVGPAVVDGIMHGELFETMEDWTTKKKVFSLR